MVYARAIVEVLQLDVSGRPQAWISAREAAVIYACDGVAWTLGDPLCVLLGGTQWVTTAVTGSGTVTGTTAAEAIIGSTGADTLTGGGGVDRFFAGLGNDTVVLTASDVSNLSAASGATRATSTEVEVLTHCASPVAPRWT